MKTPEIHFVSSNSGASSGGGVTVLKNLLSWPWPETVHLHVPGTARKLWEGIARPWLELHVHQDWKVWEFRGPRGYGPGKVAFGFGAIPDGSLVVLDSLEAMRQLVPGLARKGCILVNHVNAPDHCLKRNPLDTLRDLRRYRKLRFNVFVSRHVDRIFGADPLARVFLSRLPSCVVYSGIPMPECPVPASEKNVVYFGRYESYKNPLFLLRLGRPAAFAGTAKGCSDPVAIPAELDRGWINDKADVARLGDIFVYPSVNEAFGLAVIEMMAYGKIPLCFDSGAFGEIVSHGKNGFLIPAFDVGKAKDIIRLLEDPALCKTISEAARARALEFTIDAFGKNMFETLDRLRSC